MVGLQKNLMRGNSAEQVNISLDILIFRFMWKINSNTQKVKKLFVELKIFKFSISSELLIF